MEKLRSVRHRRIFLIVIDHGIELAVYADAPVDSSLSDLLNTVFDRMLDEDGDKPRRLRTFGDCSVFDDSMMTLPDEVLIGAIPAPGLIFVVPRSAHSVEDLGLIETDHELETPTSELDYYKVRLFAFQAVRLDETYGPRLSMFLEGPDALFDPDPLPTYKVFISFTSVDFLQASELALELAGRDVRCFLANSSISAGTLWNDELRAALRASRCLVLLASGASAESSWVLSEVGAAWVLDIPILLVPLDESPTLWNALLDNPNVRIMSRDSVLDAPELR